MIDFYIWIFVWAVILIMLIVELGKVESRLAEDRINKMFEDLKKQKGERERTMARNIDELTKEISERIIQALEANYEIIPKKPAVTMPRYIDADALMEQMENACMGIMSGCDPFNEPLKVLESAPTVDVRENVHAHWEPVHLTAFGVCSACRAKWQFTELMSFCPNCGAQMDERRGRDV